jgi:hypothetical protein
VLSEKRIGILSRAAARLGQRVFLCGVASGDGAVIIDAAQPLPNVADGILTASRRPGRGR